MVFEPITYNDLLTLAKAKDWSTSASIEKAVAKFAYKTGIDITEAVFTQEEHPLYPFINNKYQPFYTSVDEVGQHELAAGKHQSLASERMEWFASMVRSAHTLFPSLAIVWEGDLILVDGNYRASARYVAGLRTVWTYTANKPVDTAWEVAEVQERIRRDMIIKTVMVKGYVEAADSSGKLEPLEIEVTDPYLISQIRKELI